MVGVTLVEKTVVVPQTPTIRRRQFLSNLDLKLVAYYDTVAFFDAPPNHISFSRVCHDLRRALSRILVTYDFMAGRLVPALEDDRLEIDCNGAGVVFLAATSNFTMNQLGILGERKEEYKQLAMFLHEEEEGVVEMTEKPLLLYQLTQFQCGGLALASLFNHCTLDGTATGEFLRNLAAITRGEELVTMPNTDRTVFKARSPPKINHPHYEYSTPISSDTLFSVHGKSSNPPRQSLPHNLTRLIYLSSERIASLKAEAIRDGSLIGCTSFHIVAAKIWKARSMAMQLSDERVSTILFPVDVRQKIAPNAPEGFSGNAIMPGFARASARELKMVEFSSLVRKVQEGVERIEDEYVRSGIDWLEVYKGVPCRVESFSVVAWGRLGIEGEEFKWGKIKHFAPTMLKPRTIMLLTGNEVEGGMNICVELPSHQMLDFYKLMMED